MKRHFKNNASLVHVPISMSLRKVSVSRSLIHTYKIASNQKTKQRHFVPKTFENQLKNDHVVSVSSRSPI